MNARYYFQGALLFEISMFFNFQNKKLNSSAVSFEIDCCEYTRGNWIS